MNVSEITQPIPQRGRGLMGGGKSKALVSRGKGGYFRRGMDAERRGGAVKLHSGEPRRKY